MLYKIIIFIIVLVKLSFCANILGFFLIPTYSHQNVFLPIFKALAAKGHTITLITPYPSLEKPTNITEIDISFVNEDYKQLSTQLSFHKQIFFNGFQIFKSFRRSVEKMFQIPDVRKALTRNNYDIIVLEHCSPIMFLPAVLTGIPTIGVSPFRGLLHAHDSVANPTHPIASPCPLLNLERDLTFPQRLQSTLHNMFYRAYYYFYEVPKCDKLIKKYFGNDLPYLGDIEKNVSLQMFANNPITGIVKPNVQNVVEISQTHLKAPLPLPKHLQEFLDGAQNGAVYISFGTNILGTNQIKGYDKLILEALKKLPYRILWKWDSDIDVPDNIIVQNWFPQSDVLAHPNIKVFVTQGGIQSIEEAVNSTIPMVGIPLIADQMQNIKILVRKKIGLYINLKTMTSEDLRNSIIDVVENKKYKKKIKKLNILFKDQPMDGINKAVWWIEYIIRRRGAPHLRSTAVNMPLYQYYMLDILFILISVIVIFTFLIYYLFKIIFNLKYITVKLKVK